MATSGRNDGHQWGIKWPRVGRNRWPLTNASSPVVRFRHRVHCGTALTMARLMSLRAASSLGNCPLVLIAFAAGGSVQRLDRVHRVNHSTDVGRKCQGRDHVFPGVRPRLRDHRDLVPHCSSKRLSALLGRRSHRTAV